MHRRLFQFGNEKDLRLIKRSFFGQEDLWSKEGQKVNGE
ncbi:hypothetical protein P872_02110 [Rhodonellum psychrophilum GCM71 = DSM 17998]|uniref:Uncharacterized protein n=1 Tax=Rhodonellum psychrophilum GCM71 = DSM 17998 TaxID=1123057 RepID=U5C229_9BACT|nr:hypothetical protein P872_02110 [Rhodonellum psychrophilum GCM71 = DSM 17998]